MVDAGGGDGVGFGRTSWANPGGADDCATGVRIAAFPIVDGLAVHGWRGGGIAFHRISWEGNAHEAECGMRDPFDTEWTLCPPGRPARCHDDNVARKLRDTRKIV